MTTDYRALCAELLAGIDGDCHPETQGQHYSSEAMAAIARARAALAQPEPVGPTDEELDELWAEIDGGGAIWAWQPYARAVLARYGRPALTPIPVSEPSDPPSYEEWLNEYIRADRWNHTGDQLEQQYEGFCHGWRCASNPDWR